MVTKLRLVFSITIVFLSFYYGSAQNDYWQQKTSRTRMTSKSLKSLDKGKTKVFSLDKENFMRELNSVSKSSNATKTLYFPNEEGSFTLYKVRETPVLSQELAAKYPQIKSYSGISTIDAKDRIRFSVSHNGVQSMMVHKNQQRTTYMQQTTKNGKDYVVYNRDSRIDKEDGFVCKTKEELSKAKGIVSGFKLVDDQRLRKFRIAVSATGEYTKYHENTEDAVDDIVADALAAINATITRVNGVFETDLGITLELVGNNDLIIYENETTDPYDTNLSAEVQNTLTSVIGEANYDIGHLFHKGPKDGNAGYIGAVCVDNKKGSAYAVRDNPEGDTYDIDYVAHEMGHQFGANHTYSHDSEGTIVQVEPGSGTTIMGYAGIAGESNVAPNGDDYFNYYSIFQIAAYLETVSCAEEIVLTNNPPTIIPIADYVIPRSTAFVLTGNAIDIDATDVLTYAWEQIDNGIVTNTSFGPTNPIGANFRSRKPTTNPERYFPNLPQVIHGALTQTNPSITSSWETVSDVERIMNFALTVRDNADGGGQVTSDVIKVHVVNTPGVFAITSQEDNEIYAAGSVQEITWNVVDTSKLPINAETVDILLSTDGGVTFATSLATAVPNNGSYNILVPGVATSNARIMVKATDNIFFAVNTSDFSITASEIVLNFSSLEYDACQPDSIVASFIYETYLGFAEETTFSVSDAPVGLSVSFSEATATANNTSVTVTFSNTAGISVGNYPITIAATSVSVIKEVVLNLNLFNTTFSGVVLSSPIDSSIGESVRPVLIWEASSSVSSYGIEIATDNLFNTVIAAATVSENSYKVSVLGELTTYFWRVKPKNICGEGVFGTPFEFTTSKISCADFSGTGIPIEISNKGEPTVFSKIIMQEDLKLSDINVNLGITHTYIGDLVISLTSPLGTKVVLTSRSCGDFANINVIFDDEAVADFVCEGNPGINGTVKPLGLLSSFIGESIQGEWILEVNDIADNDGGMLDTFSLEFCIEGVYRPDEDKDGVFDDGDDLCLGTPKGAEVDINGCTVYRFAPNNFSIAVQSESCRDLNNGVIKITALETMDYTVSIQGDNVDVSTNFTDIREIINLNAGAYTVCITATDGTIVYEAYCFDTVVTQPDILNVTSTLSFNGKQVNINLEGADEFILELNGKLLRTSKSEITIDLKAGLNTLKVYTNLPCQGVHKQQFFISEKPIVYPNPFDDFIKVLLGASEQQILATMYAIDGRFVSRRKHHVDSVEVTLDFVELPSGVYFLHIEGENTKGTYKVIKK